jgi:hypothetical protein
VHCQAKLVIDDETIEKLRILITRAGTHHAAMIKILKETGPDFNICMEKYGIR